MGREFEENKLDGGKRSYSSENYNSLNTINVS